MDPLPQSEAGERYHRKYHTLKRKCEHLQLMNERLVNRIQHVKKIIKRYKQERRCLIETLDAHGDSYDDSQVPAMWDEVMSLLPPGAEEEMSEDSKQLLESMLLTEGATLNWGGSGGRAIKQEPVDAQAALSSALGLTVGASEMAPEDTITSPDVHFAFHMYCQHRRPSLKLEFIKTEQREATHVELSQLLVKEWKSLGPDDKKIYEIPTDLDDDFDEEITVKTEET